MQEIVNGKPDKTSRDNSAPVAIEVIRPATQATHSVPHVVTLAAAEELAETQIDFRRLLRRYGWMTLVLAIVGVIGGMASVLLGTPMYSSRLLLDIQQVRTAERSSSNGDDPHLQTQMLMIRSGGFLRRVVDRLQSETLPVSPLRNDFFTKLRTKLRPDLRNSPQLMSDGIQSAAGTLSVRPVNGTTLLEISCESTHPEIAASFVNTVASEFIDQALQSRAVDAQRSSQYLAAQAEESRAKLREAEEKLQDYVRNSGNLFAAQETTLADTSVRSFQGELTAAKADRISKNAYYEAILKAPAQEAVNLMDDQNLRGYQRKLTELRQERLLLSSRFTAQHPKVQTIDLQIQEIEKNLKHETSLALERIRKDLEASQRKESLLSKAYAGAASQVTAQATQAAQYSALKREVEILRQTYSQILMQVSQASISNALPQNTMRILDAATPASEPLRPKPLVNLSFGAMLGVVLSGGIAFLREKFDRSVKRPGSARELLSAKELGVIPSLQASQPAKRTLHVLITQHSQALLRRKSASLGGREHKDLIGWQQRTFVAESFRHAVASLLRDPAVSAGHKILLVTSPNPSDGKTTISSNLGISLAETGRKVLLLDADFRRPRLHELFGASNNGVGFSGILKRTHETGEISFHEEVQATRYAGLSLLCNGQESPNLSQLLHSDHLPRIMDALRKEYDYILIDAPPVLQIVDARIVNQAADGVILVLRSGVTDRKSALEAYRYLHEDGAHLIGTILNDWQPQRSKVDRYYSYVREHEETAPSRKALLP